MQVNHNSAIFIRSLHKGGAEKQAVLLCEGLNKRGINSKLIVFYKEGDLMQFAQHSLGMDKIVFIKKGNLIQKAVAFKIILQQLNIDSIICFLPINNIVGIISAKINGIPIIIGGIRGSKIKDNVIKMKIQKMLFNKFSTTVVSNSYKGREVYGSYGINPQKIRTIHNGFNIKPLENKRKVACDKVKILSVGRFVHEKDYDTAILAISHLEKIVEENIKWEYIIIGYGALENEIRDLIKIRGVSQRVTIIINPSNIDSYYENSNIFLMTSRFEGMPNSVMEAMSYELPVVCTNAGDTSYLVLGESNGFLNSVGDWQGIAESLKVLLQSSGKRIQMGMNGRKKLISCFGTEKMVDKYFNLLQTND